MLIFGENVEKTLDFQLVGVDGQFSSESLAYAFYTMVTFYLKIAKIGLHNTFISIAWILYKAILGVTGMASEGTEYFFIYKEERRLFNYLYGWTD